jgi:hypothetical protein
MAFSAKALQRVPGASQIGRKTARRIRKPFSPKVFIGLADSENALKSQLVRK